MQTGCLYADSAETREYEIKAAYLYNIMKFVQLPERKGTEGESKKQRIVRVGVTDKNVLMIFQGIIGNKEITQRTGRYRIEVEYVDVKQLADENRKPELDVLFIKDTARYDPRELLGACVKHGILTVGETQGFVESGGIVSFVIIKHKLRFEINVGVAEQAGIKIRSQLLKLAEKVIHKKMLP
ncbi:MAG: YfiR family protein [Phycisphaerae bacterium]|nr:YfiR family protein [Phycisphaerae bacterium]